MGVHLHPSRVHVQRQRAVGMARDRSVPAVLAVQALVGNRATTALLQRQHDEAGVRTAHAVLGAAMSQVRLHTGAAAAQSAVAAEATDQDVVFNQGRYDTVSTVGGERSAREIVHVQQQRGPVGGMPTGGSLAISDPSGPFEREDNRYAAQFTDTDSDSYSHRRPQAGPVFPAKADPGQICTTAAPTQNNAPHSFLIQDRIPPAPIVQREVMSGKFNIAGENHKETDPRELMEIRYAETLGLTYWRENEFEHEGVHGDIPELIALQMIAFLYDHLRTAGFYATQASQELDKSRPDIEAVENSLKELKGVLPAAEFVFSLSLRLKRFDQNDASEALSFGCKAVAAAATPLLQSWWSCINKSKGSFAANSVDLSEMLRSLNEEIPKLQEKIENVVRGYGLGDDLDEEGEDDPWRELIRLISNNRSQRMLKLATAAAIEGVTGIWKVGNDHIVDMRLIAKYREGHKKPLSDKIEITDLDEFNGQYSKWLSTDRSGGPAVSGRSRT